MQNGDKSTNKRPILPIGWSLEDGEIIADFVERRHFTEVYQLRNNEFLYLFLDAEITKKIVSRQIEHENVTAGGVLYPSKRYKLHNQELFSDRILKIKTKSGLEVIAGMNELKQILVRDIIHPFQNRETYELYKLGIPNGILLFGPPGCGKTYIANKIAEELSIPMLELRESDVGSPYIHATSSNIAKVFQEALRLAPSIIFIDEISGLIPKRESLTSTNQFRESEVNEFLVQIESAGERGVLVIGATNFPERIDSAALRSGRMDKRVFVPPPDYNARIELFKMEMDDRPLAQGIIPEVLGNLSEGLVSSDIKLVVDNAARKALSQKSEISMDHLRISLAEMKPSLTEEQLAYYYQFQSMQRK